MSTVKKIPFINLTADIGKDEYGKIVIDSVYINETDVLNIIEGAKYSKSNHGLTFNTNKWIPQMKDKIYFMKGCTVPRIKLKDLAVKYKIRTTTDLSAATVVVGSDRAGDKLFSSTWMHLIHPKVFIATLDALEEVCDDFDNYYRSKAEQCLEGFDLDTLEYVAVDWHTKNICNPHNNSNGPLPKKILDKLGLTIDQYAASEYAKISRNSEYLWTISDGNLETWEEVKTKNVIEQNALLEVVNGDDAVLIDLETYQNLRNMFNSSDSDNHVMAMEIMANSNYLESLLYLEMLFFHHNHQIESSRTKNHVNFKSLKNYLGRGSSSSRHIDGVIENLMSFGKCDEYALEFIMEDQKGYFAQNGYSRYIQPTSYGMNPEYAPQLNYQWVHKTPNFIDKTTVPVVEEEEIVEDTVDEVTVSEPLDEVSSPLADPEIEEEEVKTEEEATEEVLIAEKEEVKDEQGFDWF